MLRIRELRKKKNKLQKEVAQDLGIPPNTFNQYENGKREPDLATLSRIANYLDVSVDYLMGVSSSPNPGASLDELIEAIGGQETAGLPTRIFPGMSLPMSAGLTTAFICGSRGTAWSRESTRAILPWCASRTTRKTGTWWLW